MLLTNNVASVKGTCTFRDRDNAFIPALLNPTRFPEYVILLANRIRCSLSTPLVTIVTDAERRWKKKGGQNRAEASED